MMRKILSVTGGRKLLVLVWLLLCTGSYLQAQTPIKSILVKNGHIYITLSRDIDTTALDSFIVQYDLHDLDLKNFISNNRPDSLLKRGWHIDINTGEILVFSKNMIPADQLTNPAEKIRLAQKLFDNTNSFHNKEPLFGVNRFVKKYAFAVQDSLVTFFYRGNTNAQKLMLAGSFNNWQPETLPMQKVDSGWIVTLKLGPGKYYYKFIADGKWLIDKDNELVENDGEGNDNSVYYKTNFVFRLEGYLEEKKLSVAGSFNNWKADDIRMEKTRDGWIKDIYLAPGTHTYRFVAGNRWFSDPANSNSYPNEFGETNSVISFGSPHLFELKGYPDAKKVMLKGSFNQWRDFELEMKKTDSGWVLPYVLNHGNYEYNFEIDGKKARDPGTRKQLPNHVLIIAPNTSFVLKGFGNARQVYIAGTFNNWSPKGFAMQKQEDNWVIQQHLAPGKHAYKFVVDGKWIVDPANELREPNEFGEENSVIWKKE